jgi:hypothetical protein
MDLDIPILGVPVQHQKRTIILAIQIPGARVPQQAKIMDLDTPILGVPVQHQKRTIILATQIPGARVLIVPGSVLISTELKGVARYFLSSQEFRKF